MQRPWVTRGYGWVYATCATVWASGALWLILHYFFTHETEMGLAPHPLEHWSLVLHGAAAFASLWLMGFLWGTHVVKRWRLKRHRKSGGLLFTVMLLLVVTGYLLYYLSSDEIRAPTALVHWVVGLGMPLALLVHWSIRSR